MGKLQCVSSNYIYQWIILVYWYFFPISSYLKFPKIWNSLARLVPHLNANWKFLVHCEKFYGNYNFHCSNAKDLVFKYKLTITKDRYFIMLPLKSCNAKLNAQPHVSLVYFILLIENNSCNFKCENLPFTPLYPSYFKKNH